MKATLFVFAGLASKLPPQGEMANISGNVQPVRFVWQRYSTERKVVAKAVAAVANGRMPDFINVLSRAGYPRTIKPPSGNAEFTTISCFENIH